MDVVKRGILIAFATKLGNGLCEVLARRKLNGSSTLPIATTRIIETPHMLFTNPIMITHVNRTLD
jgi:hypothetical protein